MNTNHKRNPSSLLEKSRRRLLRRIKKCESQINSARSVILNSHDVSLRSYAEAQQEILSRQLVKLKESYAIKFELPKVFEESAKPKKKPRAVKKTAA